MEFPAALDVPKMDRPVKSRRDGAMPIGQESDALDTCRITPEAADFGPCRRVPEDRVTVIPSGEHAPAGRRDGQTPNHSRVSFELAHNLTGLDVPDAHG